MKIVFNTLVKCDRMHDPAKIAAKEIIKKKLNQRFLVNQKSVIIYFIF